MSHRTCNRVTRIKITAVLPAPVLYPSFQEHAISGTHAFSHINSGDLTGMGFRLGEIINLKEAIGVWATAKHV
jgi:hypothetical protein